MRLIEKPILIHSGNSYRNSYRVLKSDFVPVSKRSLGILSKWIKMRFEQFIKFWVVNNEVDQTDFHCSFFKRDPNFSGGRGSSKWRTLRQQTRGPPSKNKKVGQIMGTMNLFTNNDLMEIRKTILEPTLKIIHRWREDVV